MAGNKLNFGAILDMLMNSRPDQNFGEARRAHLGRQNAQSNLPRQVVNYATQRGTSPDQIVSEFQQDPRSLYEQGIRDLGPEDAQALIDILERMSSPQQSPTYLHYQEIHPANR